MATSAISSEDLTKLRADQYIDDIALHITPLVTIQSGTITAIPTVSPFVSITWDGSTSGIEVGHMVKITNGSTLKAWAVIRKLPSGAALYISTTPLGSAGISTQIENSIEVGDTVTVYSHRPLWGMYSRIAEGVFYKSWDIPYTDQNENVPPVSNSGAWQVAKLANGVSTHTFTLPKEGANTSFAFSSFTISSYLWSLPTGVTLASGFNLTDDVIDVDAIAGTHLVSLTITDSNANTHTSYLWLFVSDGTTGTSLSERYVISDMTGTSTRQGTEITFTITGENLQDVIYPSAGIVLRQWAKFDDSELSDNVLIDTFVGYIKRDGISATHNGDVGSLSVTFASPVIIASSIVQPSQSLEDVSSPANWAECDDALSNLRGHLFYAIQWHTPNLLSMHDFDAPFATPRKKFGTFNSTNLGAAMRITSDYVAGNLGSTADGKTTVRKNPLYMSNTDRNAVANIITWQEQDIDPDKGFDYVKRMGSQLAESSTGAFAYDGTARKAWAAAKFWNQGVGKAQLPNFIVTIAEGIGRILEVVGHFFAEQNSDIRTMPLNLNGLQDVIDPSLMLWCSLNVSSEFDPYGVGFVNKRMLPMSVDRSWAIDENGVSLEITLSVQPETFGQIGEEVAIGNANTYLSGGWSIATDTPFTPAQDNNAFGSIIILHDDNGKFAMTYNRFVSNIEWTDLSSSVDSEVVHDWDFDWNSAYFDGNDATAPLGIYAVTSSGASLNIWYFADILNSLIATNIHTYTMNDSSCTSEARIECSETTTTYVGVGWHDQTGTEFGYSNDGGATWQAKANVGSTTTDTANDNAPLGMDIDAAYTLISAPDATPEYGVYRASTVGGSFSAVANTERTSEPQPMIKIEPSGSIAYVSTIGAGGGGINATVTFDAGGYAYTLPDTPTPNVGTIAANGNPGNAVFDNATNIGLYIAAEMDLLAVYALTSYSIDYYADAHTDATIEIYIDGVLDTTIVPTVSIAWTTVSGSLSTSGQVVEIRLVAGPNSLATDRLDNLNIVGSAVASTALFKVEPFTGTPTWTDITPSSDETPERPHDLIIDLIDPLVLDTVSDNSKNWYTSTDGGTSWGLSEAASNKRTFLTAGETLLAAGNGEVKISFDAGANFDDLTGNLSSVWGGTIGNIKRVNAL